MVWKVTVAMNVVGYNIADWCADRWQTCWCGVHHWLEIGCQQKRSYY